MKITIERPETITPEGVTAWLNERKLRVPVFFDTNTNIVINIHSRSRHLPRALELIEWLGTR